MHALGAAASPRAARYRFRKRSGAEIERLLVAAPADGAIVYTAAWYYPAFERERWVSLLALDLAPWVWADPGRFIGVRHPRSMGS
ncbi:MAG: hypothetical protein WDM79_18970 [Terricaulis sp.]